MTHVIQIPSLANTTKRFPIIPDTMGLFDSIALADEVKNEFGDYVRGLKPEDQSALEVGTVKQRLDALKKVRAYYGREHGTRMEAYYAQLVRAQEQAFAAPFLKELAEHFGADSPHHTDLVNKLGVVIGPEMSQEARRDLLSALWAVKNGQQELEREAATPPSIDVPQEVIDAVKAANEPVAPVRRRSPKRGRKAEPVTA